MSSARRHGQLTRQEGMTLIEVAITMLVISIGTLATLGGFTAFSSATGTAQERAVLTSLAQREIEQLKPIPYEQLALSAQPGQAALQEAPLTGPAADEEVATGGIVRPGGDAFTIEGESGRVYRYVTYREQSCAGITAKVQTGLAGQLGQAQSAVEAALADLCPGNTQTKRITVVIVSDDGGRPVRLSTVEEDPSSATPEVLDSVSLAVARTVATTASGDSPDAPVTQEFRLLDTRCNLTARSATTTHETHDTSKAGATCTSGSRPDLMSPVSIPGVTSDPVADYSEEIDRAAAGGLVMMRDTQAGGCTDPGALEYSEGESDTRKRSLHTWATNAAAAPFSTALSAGRATINVFTRTADGTPGPGRLCVTLRRASTGEIVGSSDYKLAGWPGEPTPMAVSFELPAFNGAVGERLLMTLRVPQDSAEDLQVLYDHPAYPSSLSITTEVGSEFQ